MGILDNLKNVLGAGKKDDIEAPTAGPSQILRENGLDSSGLKFTFGSDGTVTVQGSISREPDRAKIIEVLRGSAGISNVIDHMTVVRPASESQPQATGTQAEPPTGEAAGAAVKTYTVKPGDTLWKIASQHYGNGSQYMKIFEANKGVLKDPDHSYPGQELVLPDAQN